MTIHVVIGPPCSGKSTFVELNAPAGTPRFDFEKIAARVAGTEEENEPTVAVIETVLAMRRGLMGWLLDPEVPSPEIWVVNAAPTQGTIDAFVAVGAQFIVLDPGQEECIARAMRAGRSEETIQAIKNWYASPPVIPEQKGGGDMIVKNAEFQIKAVADDQENDAPGEIEAYASVFNVVDSYGDVVMPGAFSQTLKDWEAAGRSIPLLYGHDFRDPFSNIGTVTKAVEDDHGLRITATIDLDNEKAAQVHRLILEKRLNEMSFAFRVVNGGWGERESEEVYEIHELKLFEVSVVPIGANSATEILSAKSTAKLLTTAAKQAATESTTPTKKSGLDAAIAVISDLAGISPAPSAEEKSMSFEQEKLALQIKIMEEF